MITQRTVFVRCRFTRGGFAHERIFYIPTPDGNGEYRGLAFINYCYKSAKKRLLEGEPPAGESIEGLLVGRLISEEDSIATIQVPDGELCDVSTNAIQEYRDVPVGS